MEYEENYLVEFKSANGRIRVDAYNDVVSATDAYNEARSKVGPGERAKLVRCSSMVLALRARA